MSQNKYICIHGHFYQPPRENAWLEEIQNQVSAAPFNNWNERINYECYAPNRAARILNRHNQIKEIVNNYENISFNIGPTLMSWLEENDVPTYQDIIEADQKSVVAHNGHGNALAQIYNHLIMPLANREDQVTQVKWGLYDFESRFGRKAEGVWLSETAVDTPTLEVLSEEGVLFTILAPRQLEAIRAQNTEDWTPVNEGNIDTTRPYLIKLPSGRAISVFFYDGRISQKVAFEGILKDGKEFAENFIEEASMARPDALINIATDGESYGHHHRFGEMALASCIQFIKEDNTCTLTNYGQYLEMFPPEFEARIHENSSWSCFHGVERWRNDCGCSSDNRPGWNQQYRKPLRDSLNWLRAEISDVFRIEGSKLFKDPLQAKYEYIKVILNRDEIFVKDFISKHIKIQYSESNAQHALKLLEMERHANLMFTSCGWFFDEVSGLETTQILQYARRAITHAEFFGARIEGTFREKLEGIPSNKTEYVNALKVYETIVLPAEIRLEQVAMHISVLSIFERVPAEMNLYKFYASNIIFKRESQEKNHLVLGRAKMKSTLTHATLDYTFGVLYLGQVNIVGYINVYEEREDFLPMIEKARTLFKEGEVHELIGHMHQYFGAERFGFNNLFQDEKVNLLNIISRKSMRTAVDSFREIYHADLHILQDMNASGFPVLKGYISLISFVLNADILDELTAKGKVNYKKLNELTDEMKKWKVLPEDPERLALLAEKKMFEQFLLYDQKKDPEHLINISNMISWVESLSLPINLWQSQNEFNEIIKDNMNSAFSSPILMELGQKLNFEIEKV